MSDKKDLPPPPGPAAGFCAALVQQQDTAR